MGKTLAELQSNISISALNAVTGTLLWVDDYTGFSGDPAELSGNYIALKISAEALGEELEGATITATYHGRTVTLDSDQIIIVRQAEGEDSITFTANKEGYTEGRLTLDLSGLTLLEELVKIAVAGRSPGVMITPILPLVSGSSISIIGRVPWNTTTNRNECAYRVFINRLSAVGTNNLVRIYYNSANPVVLATGVLTDSDGHGAVIIDTPMPAAAIADGTIYFEVLKLDSNNQVVATYTIEADASALTLEAPPLEALWYNLTGSKTYNDVTYTNEDLITGGIITRDNNSNVHRLSNIHFKWHPEFLDDIWDTDGYGVILTTNNSAYAEYYSKAIPVTGLRFTDNIIIEKNEWYTLPHSYLLKWPRSGVIAAVHWRGLDGSTGRTGQAPLYSLSNVTYESDPRNTVPATVTYLLEGNYNNTPITSYFTANSLTSNSPVTLYDQSGYYIFLKIATSESDLSIRFIQLSTNNLNPISYTDVTSDITGVTLGSNDIILKLDISTLNIKLANTGITLQLAKQGFKPNKNAFELQNNVYNLPAYTNGLTGRNIGISPLSSTVKAAGFGNYCDITFTPIDPATATVVNDEVTISVSGTLKKKSTTTYLTAPSTDYIPMYKNYTNIGQNIVDNIDFHMNIDAKYYYIIFEAENIIPVNSGKWKCSGVSGGNESSPPVTDAEMSYPMIINGTSHKTVWAIHIPENLTSISIHCIPTNTNEFTEVTYTFDLTNVTYGTIS